MELLLFTIGASFGSFLNVIATRYDPDLFLIRPDIVSGRSRCPSCSKTLRWFELIPILSFILQKGRCRTCGVPLSVQYLIVEILGGSIFLFTSLHFPDFYFPPVAWWVYGAWIGVLLLLLLVSLIDFRLRIIPDEINIALAALGGVIAFSKTAMFGVATGSLLGPYAAIFGFRENVWSNHLFGALVGGGFFLFLILITRGRGMGMGDAKLGTAIGFLLGWPDVLIAVILAFVIGSLVSLFLMTLGKATLKGFLPFGPFLALAVAILFFFGKDLFAAYLGLIGF